MKVLLCEYLSPGDVMLMTDKQAVGIIGGQIVGPVTVPPPPTASQVVAACEDILRATVRP